MLTLKTKSLSFSRPSSPSRTRSTTSSALPSPVSATTLSSEPEEVPSAAGGAPAAPLARKGTPPPPFTAAAAAAETAAASSKRPSSSRRASPKGTHLVALTPAIALEDPNAGAVQRRTTSQDRAFRPIRSLSATAASVAHGGAASRSKSSDRVSDLSMSTSLASQGGVNGSNGAAPTGKKLGGAGGLMASIGKAGLRLAHSQSQPGTSRSHDEGALLSPALSSASGFPSPGLPSGAVTPSSTSNAGGGTNIEQFAESFIAKVSLRLGEVVNRMFVPAPHGPGGAVDKQLEAAEAPYGGNGVSWKGRPAPRLVKAKEFGERIAAELQAAHHDSYLLRTLLRSAILKSLSLFFTRLSALLLVPSTTDAALHPSVFAAPRTLKDLDSLPLALKYNLHIVRCAYEVKRALSLVADPNVGVAFPAHVDETLKPWRAKLAELMNRVMGPLIQSARVNIAEACLHARSPKSGDCPLQQCLHCRDGASASALGLSGLPAPATLAGKVSATSQLRSLSLGRASPAPSATSSAKDAAGAGANGQHAASAWVRDVSAQFEAFGKLIGRLECGVDADKWIVTVATAAAWKGMLNLAARPLVAPAPAKTPSVAGSSESSLHAPVPEKHRRSLLGGTKKTPSPPHSPPLPAGKDLAAGEYAQTDLAFVRLLFDVESLEARLKAFLASNVSTPAHVLAPAFASSVGCPAAATAAGCGLCRTGRTFDDDSSDSEDDDDAGHHQHHHRPGHESARESKLALSAMREAMQALSAMIVVVRASHHLDALREAIDYDGAAAGLTPVVTTPGIDAPQPMTPATLFARSGTPVAAIPPSTSMTAAKAPAIHALSQSPPLAACPTLQSALLTLPPLILLHLVAARISPPASHLCPIRKDSPVDHVQLAFHLPHESWNLQEGWVEYARELRGFAAGEEWAPEVAVELATEARRVLAIRQEADVLSKHDQVALETLEVVARKASH